MQTPRCERGAAKEQRRGVREDPSLSTSRRPAQVRYRRLLDELTSISLDALEPWERDYIYRLHGQVRDISTRQQAFINLFAAKVRLRRFYNNDIAALAELNGHSHEAPTASQHPADVPPPAVAVFTGPVSKPKPRAYVPVYEVPLPPRVLSGVRERDDAYPCFVADGDLRVIECRDGIQWILQRRCRNSTRWDDLGYFRNRDVLIQRCGMGAEALAALKALPKFHLGRVETGSGP